MDDRQAVQGWQDWELDVEDAVDALEEAVGPDGRPSWGAWHWDDSHLEVHDHPEDLFGLVAPPWVVAAGVSSTGRATPLDGEGAPCACRISCVVARDGRVAARLRIGDDLVPDPPREGRVLDTLRRCLGVPTDPPPVPLAPVLVVVLWLQALAAASRPGTRRLAWSEAARLHPAAAVAAGDDVAALADAAASLSWEGLRLLASCGAATLVGVPPEVAAWMDEGMLAREVLGGPGTADRVVARGRLAVDAAAREALDASIGLVVDAAGPAAADGGGPRPPRRSG